MTGSDEAVALADAITSFHARLDEAGVENELAVWSGGRARFQLPADRVGATFDRLYAFLARHLSGPDPSG